MRILGHRRGIDPDGAVVVITGASSGIGRATARLFAAEHARLCLAARSADALEGAAAECREAGAASVTTFPFDVSDADGHGRLVERALAEHGRIDVWVNDAAVMSYGTVEQTPVEIQRRIIEVNLLGMMWGTRAVVPVFRRQRRGVLINVSSLYGKMATPYVSGYAASKFGILGFSQAVRQELHDLPDVSVCTVLPGSMDTPIFGHAANYLGRRVKPVPPVSSPWRVARVIVRLARRPRSHTDVGQLQHLASLGHALMPGTYGDLAPTVMRFVAVGDERIEPGPGNVLRPDPTTDGVSGHWRNRPARIAATAAVAVGIVGAGRLLRGRKAALT
ncbi:SDR family NAD(P)-dependent oxidoreductase [Nocardioides cheoyonin]|uniref:SDR family NAD(P)-dependent oxidoreductase n=1 Tax=Nocardioides cheoyonin TaxID=3156615 RepID=UPI0032B53941